MEFEAVIGLEVHVQLNTQSKAFCADANDFGKEPNTNVSAISLAHPGTLPRPNYDQLRSAIKIGLAIQSDITRETFFDRKNYFYADLPKGYQITQDKAAICKGGHFTIFTNGFDKNINIHQIHMEEDAGKSIHDKHPDYSLIDLNRAGTPLLEIVTDPDLRSPEEAAEFIKTVRQMVRYLGISDGDMEKGSLRCDCNISIRPKGSNVLNTRCEIKNVNSINYAKRAIEYEIKRQIECHHNGETIIQSTLTFDPVTGKTSPMREKENAHDYRYFPDPDLPLIQVTDDDLKEIKSGIDALPFDLFSTLINKYQLTKENAQIITAEKEPALHFLATAKEVKNIEELTKLYLNKILPIYSETPLENISTQRIVDLLTLMDNGDINKTAAYQILFPKMLESVSDVQTLAKDLDLIQDKSASGDTNALLIQSILDGFPDELAKYKSGKKNLMGFFMGEVMKATRGKVDPKDAQTILKDLLNN